MPETDIMPCTRPPGLCFFLSVVGICLLINGCSLFCPPCDSTRTAVFLDQPLSPCIVNGRYAVPAVDPAMDEDDIPVVVKAVLSYRKMLDNEVHTERIAAQWEALMTRYPKWRHQVKPGETGKLLFLANGGIANTVGMRFVYVPAGTFMMGSPLDEKGRGVDESLHQVSLTKGFYMQTTEVTVGQWRRFVKETGYRSLAETDGGTWIWNGTEWEKMAGFYWDNPSFHQNDCHPVKCVSWYDTKAFIGWISQKEDVDYRLPTEAQWEYACRAGGTNAFYSGPIANTGCEYMPSLHTVGVFCGNSGWKTHEVASKQPNMLGLYDMHGNAWEWCEDWKGPYPETEVMDPAGSGNGIYRVARGGSWDDKAPRLRCAFRGILGPRGRSHRLGFRLVMIP